MERNSVEKLFYGEEQQDSENEDILLESTQQDAEHVFQPKKPDWVQEEGHHYHHSHLQDSRNISKRKRRMAKREKKRQAHPVLYNFIDWVKVIAAAIAIALFLNYFVIINSTVPSGSMEPTIMTGSRMIGFRLSYALGDVERGDIIIFKYPDDTSVNYVKRVIGLPGETVEIKDGYVYIDGEILEEDYLDVVTEGEFGPYVVPEGCYFVLGDNRNNSHDSRYWANTYVPEENIIGKAVFCYWPVSEIGRLK